MHACMQRIHLCMHLLLSLLLFAEHFVLELRPQIFNFCHAFLAFTLTLLPPSRQRRRHVIFKVPYIYVHMYVCECALSTASSKSLIYMYICMCVSMRCPQTLCCLSCVLLLQTVFSYYRLCSLTTDFVLPFWHLASAAGDDNVISSSKWL